MEQNINQKSPVMSDIFGLAANLVLVTSFCVKSEETKPIVLYI